MDDLPAQHQSIEQPINANFKKKLVVLGGIAFLLLVILASIFFLRNPTPMQNLPPESSREVEEYIQSESELTWKLILSYDLPKNTLSLDSIELLNKKIRQDFRNAKNSNTELLILDKNNASVYSTHIAITAYYPDMPLPTNDTLPKTTLYIPYQKNAAKLWILQRGKLILQVDLFPNPSLPNSVQSFSIVKKAFAEQLSDCRPIQIVFISDGYNDFNEFHSDTEKIEEALSNTEPFTREVFDFKTIDNSTPLNCGTIEGGTACLNDSRVTDMGTDQYPDASIFAIISNTTMGGGTAKKPGNVAIIRKNANDSFGLNDIGDTGIHEILGHALSGLQERYVMSTGPLADQFDNAFRLFGPFNNCSVNSEGEDWWAQARQPSGQNAYAGCAGSANLYAPEPLSCSTPAGVAMVGTASVAQLGTPESIMSSPPCPKSQFDMVEQYWIKNNVLPNYSCSPKPQPTLKPRATPTFASSPTPVSIKQYTCEYNESCSEPKKSIQLCALRCTSK